MHLGHVRWAKTHDWYASHHGEPGSIVIVCRDVYRDDQGEWQVRRVEFCGFRALRAWAGY